jgi:hypothetical protein
MTSSNKWASLRKEGQEMNASNVDNLVIGRVHAPCVVNNKSPHLSHKQHSLPMVLNSVVDRPTLAAKVLLSGDHHLAKVVVEQNPSKNATIVIRWAIGLVTVLNHLSLIKEGLQEVEEGDMELVMAKDIIDFKTFSE